MNTHQVTTPPRDHERFLGTTWEKGIPRLQTLADLVAVVLAMVAAQLLRFGGAGALPSGENAISYTWISLVIGGGWLLALGMTGSRDIKVFGVGGEEYKRVVAATLYLFGLVAIVSYVAAIETARGYVALALPIGLVLLVLLRFVVRRIVARYRNRGQYQRRVLLIGSPGSVKVLYDSLTDAAVAGYRPVAAILPGFAFHSPEGEEELPLPVVSVDRSVDEILRQCLELKVDAVAVSSGAQLSPRRTRALSWELQAHGISLIMAPALVDVAGPRIHTQPISGLPLIHVSTPKLEGGKAVTKRVFDVVASGLGLLVLSPFLLLVAVLIKIDDPGPVFFLQERVGKDGEHFRMIKFRSMVTNAEELKKQLQADAERDNDVLFKMKDDPRITRVGKVIRRTSIDELPQLFNVLKGEMSLVGPRPPLQEEVDTYEDHVHRRFLVQPGITGLWQVSGRSDLSWEDSVRLDLYYVENWSLIQDMVILFRTVRAVAASDGAY